MLTLSGSLAGNRATFTNITHLTIFSSPFFKRFAINPFHIRRSEKSLHTSMQFLSIVRYRTYCMRCWGVLFRKEQRRPYSKYIVHGIYRLKGTPMQGETAERW